jgi:hypothetical protein
VERRAAFLAAVLLRVGPNESSFRFSLRCEIFTETERNPGGPALLFKVAIDSTGVADTAPGQMLCKEAGV